MKIKLDSDAIMPTRAHDTDAGLDLYATQPKKIPARGSAIFDTGVHVELPSNTAGFIKSKSGTGSICVKLYNHGDKPYQIERGDKISQLVVVKIETPTLELVDELEETDRGNNGFGSTGR